MVSPAQREKDRTAHGALDARRGAVPGGDHPESALPPRRIIVIAPPRRAIQETGFGPANGHDTDHFVYSRPRPAAVMDFADPERHGKESRCPRASGRWVSRRGQPPTGASEVRRSTRQSRLRAAPSRRSALRQSPMIAVLRDSSTGSSLFSPEALARVEGKFDQMGSPARTRSRAVPSRTLRSRGAPRRWSRWRPCPSR